jgi:hypothetical protein
LRRVFVSALQWNFYFPQSRLLNPLLVRPGGLRAVVVYSVVRERVWLNNPAAYRWFLA